MNSKKIYSYDLRLDPSPKRTQRTQSSNALCELCALCGENFLLQASSHTFHGGIDVPYP